MQIHCFEKAFNLIWIKFEKILNRRGQLGLKWISPCNARANVFERGPTTKKDEKQNAVSISISLFGKTVNKHQIMPQKTNHIRTAFIFVPRTSETTIRFCSQMPCSRLLSRKHAVNLVLLTACYEWYFVIQVTCKMNTQGQTWNENTGTLTRPNEKSPN